MPLQRCPGCDADLASRRRCLSCEIDLVDEGARVRGTLSRIGERELEIALGSGKTLKACLSPGVRRLGEELREGVELVALGAPERVFDEPHGGLRDAPERRERFVVKTYAAGPYAAEILRHALAGREELEEIPWPEGLGVDPLPARSRRWQLRLRLRPKPFPWLAFWPLIPLLFFGANVALIMSPRSRPLVIAGVLTVILLFALIAVLRGRVLLLDADYLRLQRGLLPVVRRRFLPTKEIAAVQVAGDGSGHAIELLTTAGRREPLLRGLSDRARALLVARLLESALGVGPSADSGEPEIRGALPDLGSLLRPPPALPEDEDEAGRREEPVRYEDPVAKGVSGVRRGQRLELTVSKAGVPGGLIYLVGLAVLYLSIEHNHLFTHGPRSIVDGLALAVVALGAYSLLAVFVNRTTFVVAPHLFQVHRGPLPWPGSLRCPLIRIARLGAASKSGFLHAFLYDGRRACLLREGGGRAMFLKKTLSEEIRRARELARR